MALDLDYYKQRYLISFVVRKRKRRCFAASFFCALVKSIMSYELINYLLR